MNKRIKFLIFTFLIAAALLIIIGILAASFCYMFADYMTTDINDYGNYIGNRNNEFAQQFISRFFPPVIEDYYEDVRYYYYADHTGYYTFEAYLEFVIEEEQVFNDYIKSISYTHNVIPFHFDNSYQEIVLYDEASGERLDQLRIDGYIDADNKDPGYYLLWSASIAKILYNPSDNRVIYIALAAHEDSGDTKNMGTFFSRFNIDPKEYEAYTRSAGQGTVCVNPNE